MVHFHYFHDFLLRFFISVRFEDLLAVLDCILIAKSVIWNILIGFLQENASLRSVLCVGLHLKILRVLQILNLTEFQLLRANVRHLDQTLELVLLNDREIDCNVLQLAARQCVLANLRLYLIHFCALRLLLTIAFHESVANIVNFAFIFARYRLRAKISLSN